MGALGRVSRSLLLIVPATAAWALTVVWPTVRLVLASLDGPVPGGFGSTLLAALSVVVLPLVVFVVVGCLLGWAGNRMGRRARLVARCAVALPVAFFAPPAVAGVAWLVSGPGYDRSHIAGGRAVVTDVRIAMLVGTFALMCAAGAVAYLAAFRGGRRPVLVVTGLAALTAAAAGVQAFTAEFLILGPSVIGFGPSALPASQIFVDALDFSAYGWADEWGPAAAGSVMVLAVLAVLGILAVGLLIVTGTRMVVLPGLPVRRPPGRPRAGLVGGLTVAAVLVVLAVLAATGDTVVQVAWRAYGGAGQIDPDTAGRLAGSWLPALPSAVASVGMAGLAGFGIGALRPLGRSSELLLLPFAPWLFVGVAPYAIARLLDVRVPLVSHTPPMWLSVPALVVFTLLFAGQEKAYRHAVAQGVPPRAAFIQAYVRPVVPLVVLVGLVVWAVRANDYFWWVLLAFPFDAKSVRLGFVPPLPLVLAAAAVLVAAQFSLDRLAVVTRGREAESPAPVAPPSVAPAAPLPSAPSGRANLRIMLVCGAMGIVFAGAGILVGCGVNTGPPPRLPGVPSAGPSGVDR